METIAILLSTYNGEKYIKEQMESLLSQSNVRIHIFVRDDGSTDHTFEILKSFQENHPDAITLWKENNIGWRKSFVELLEKVSGYEYYAFSDQDDVWCKDKLSSAIDKIENIKQPNAEAILYIGNAWITDEKLKIIKAHCPEQKNMLERPLNQIILSPSMPGGLTYVFNEEVRENILKMKKLYRYGHDALAYHTSLALGKVLYDEKPHTYYRQHGNNVYGSSRGRIVSWLNSVQMVIGKNDTSMADFAAYILETFPRQAFNPEYYSFMVLLEKTKKNVHRRFTFIRRYNIRRERWIDTVRLRVKILLGKI